MSAELSWFKSSYSDSSGSACLEVAYTWRKSSHSSDFEDACVEVAACPHTVHVRDSKLGARSPRFAVPAGAWTAFLAYASREA
ncbi:DUF397 domain-containing protein [Streptomyces sp. F001]|uniref:DUF397 domain-containing protein n=1 Tax=Streptomyces sp. F001 TaxID=1510026 RepID=UPI00101E7A78|nr:DUF397 domain-containing protein [Streptomyces sp. F001]RZB17637.1 DUF397 domain-containing protein [Streptomyces sp. F001]